MNHWRRATAGLLGVSLVLLVGCGGDGDSDAADAVSTTRPAGASTTVQGGGIAGAVTAECLRYAQFAASVGAAIAAAVNPAAAAQLEALEREWDIGDAPDEIRDDFAVLLDYAKDLGEVLARYPASGQAVDPAAMAAIAAFSQSVDQERIDKASDNLSAWIDTHCPD